MSGSNNNFTPASRNWQTGYDYGAYVPSSNGWNNTRAMYPLFGSVSFPNANRGLHHPWQQLLGETMLEPPGVPEPYFPPLIQVTDDGMAREIYPTQRPIIQGSPPRFMNQLSSPPRFMNQQSSPLRSPPRFMNQQNIQVPSRDSRLTPDEQKTALKKLKKEIYNPTPKKLMRGLSLYYRDNAKNIYAKMQKEKDNNDGKNCAVCLEDFESGEKVMLTPCNHMFHEECIVPWIKSNGQCPVCRFALCERITTNASANNFPNVQANDLLARELMAVIMAMEEAFPLGNTTHY